MQGCGYLYFTEILFLYHQCKIFVQNTFSRESFLEPTQEIETIFEYRRFLRYFFKFLNCARAKNAKKANFARRWPIRGDLGKFWIQANRCL